ncbi:hypothetical protein MT418_003421 [Batrachochytrium dendrobatidis]
MLCLVQSIQSRYKAIYGHSVMSKRTASKKCLPRQSNILVKPSPNPDSPLWISKFADGSIRLNTLVKPGTKVSQVIDIQGDAVGIQIAAVAREGEANAELIQTVADVLKLRKYQVVIVAGHKSRTKVLKIDTLLSIEQIQEMILSSMPQ